MHFSKRLCSLLLCAIMVLCSVAVGGEGIVEVFNASAVKVSAIASAEYFVGDIIYYGSYPQSEIVDRSLIFALNAAGGTWKSYGYYTGTGDFYDGQMKPSDYMRYKDVSYNGNKYRAVTFDSYRPCYTGDKFSASNTYQYSSGYTIGNVYWFKYEPIRWRVIDPSTGLIMCATAIDSQAFNNYVWYGIGSLNSSSAYYGDIAHTYYASNYANSSIRKWLNDDFYNTAFSEEQKSNILFTVLDNGSSCSAISDATSTTDKIFLLSHDETLNSDYGFSSNPFDYDSARLLKSTDYAKCQGCYCYKNTSKNYYGNCWWWLRSPVDSERSQYVFDASSDGRNSEYINTYFTYGGVVPALRLSHLKSYISIEIPAAIIGLVYNGEEQTGVEAGIGYTIENNIAINAGDYIAVLKLEEGYVWSDGTAEPKEITWSISERADYSALHTVFNSIEDIISNQNDFNTLGEAWAVFSEKYSNAALVDGELVNTEQNQLIIENAAEELSQASTLLRLAKAKSDASAELETAMNNAKSDEAKSAIVEAIATVNKAMTIDGVIAIKSVGLAEAASADKTLAEAKTDAISELDKAKSDAKSDEAKRILENAKDVVSDARNVNAVNAAKSNAISASSEADKANAEKIKFDNVKVKVAGAKAIDYRSIVTITAVATDVPEDYYLTLYVNGVKVKKGDNKSVSYSVGELKSDVNYTVKVVDKNGNVAKDSNGNDLSKEDGKITVNAEFFKKLVAFFKGLFKKLPVVEVKP